MCVIRDRASASLLAHARPPPCNATHRLPEARAWANCHPASHKSTHPCGVFVVWESFSNNEFASLLGLAASAASPSPPAFCLPRWARGISRQPKSTHYLPPCSGSRHQPPALVLSLFASRVGLAASAASPSPRTICLPARARRISGKP